MAKEPVSIRLPEHIDLEDIDRRAEERGKSRSAFLSDAVQLVAEMDDTFLARVEKFAAKLRIPVSLVIQNRLIRLFAQEDAAVEVQGPRSVVLDEFLMTSEGVITGEALYNHLKEQYVAKEVTK